MQSRIQAEVFEDAPYSLDELLGLVLYRAEQGNVDVICSQEKCTTKKGKTEHKKTGVRIAIPLEDILQTSKLSLEDAAKNLKVSRSTLKRACREYDIRRWPPRKKNKVGHSQTPTEQVPQLTSDPPASATGVPSEQIPQLHLPASLAVGVPPEQIPQLNSDPPALATCVCTKTRDTIMQIGNVITIKAKYVDENITIKFGLPLSSGLVELEQQVTKRLKLEAGTYYVKYQDEDNDLILIACDEDLQDYIRISTSLANTSIVVLLELKKQKYPQTNLNLAD